MMKGEMGSWEKSYAIAIPVVGCVVAMAIFLPNGFVWIGVCRDSRRDGKTRPRFRVLLRN